MYAAGHRTVRSWVQTHTFTHTHRQPNEQAWLQISHRVPFEARLSHCVVEGRPCQPQWCFSRLWVRARAYVGVSLMITKVIMATVHGRVVTPLLQPPTALLSCLSINVSLRKLHLSHNCLKHGAMKQLGHPKTPKPHTREIRFHLFNKTLCTGLKLYYFRQKITLNSEHTKMCIYKRLLN